MAARNAEYSSVLIRAAGIGLAYGAVAYLLLSLTRFDGLVEAVWFSNAILVWGLATSPNRDWPLLIGFGALGHVAAHMAVGDSLAFNVVFLFGNMAECALAGFLLRRMPEALRFERRTPTLYFFGVSLLAPAVSACIVQAGYVLVMGAPMPLREMAIWFAVDLLGLVVFLPPLAAAAAGRWGALREKLPQVLFAFAVILAALAVALVLQLAFVRLLLLPFFVLLAFWIGVAGVQLCLAVLMAAWAALIIMGYSFPVYGGADMRTNLLLAQAVLIVFASTLVPLAVIVEQRARLTKALQDTLEETREAWGAIIGAEARYQLVVSNVSETVMRVAPGGEILFASPACSALLGVEHGFEGRNMVEMLHPDDAPYVVERARQSVEQGLFNLPQRWRGRARADDGDWHVIEARVTPVQVGKRGEHEFIIVLRPAEDVETSERQLRA